MSEPTQPGRKRKPRTGRAALIAVAVTAVVAGAAALAYVVGWGIADDKQPAVERQVQCASIKREHDAWQAGFALTELPKWKDVDPGVVTQPARERGKAFAGAVNGYTDQATKDLSLALANYNITIVVLHAQADNTGSYEEESYQQALAAQGKVNDAYSTFWAGCALSGVS